MFEILYQIYLAYGYSKNDIAEQILKNNLYGLDIAGQLSILSVLLKAREYDKNIFNKDIVRNLNIMSIQESNNINDSIIDNISNDDEKNKAKYLINNFKNAKEIGSLLILEDNDYNNLEKEIENNNTIFGIELRDKLIPLINNAKILSNKYDIVVTNPPYLSNSVMSSNLKKYIQEHYENVKSDLFAAFIIRNSTFGKNETYLGLMIPMVWMFISSYDNLRKYIIEKLNITSLIQLEYSALEEATVPICTFILNNTNNNQNGIYFRLTDYKGGMERQKDKYIEILQIKTAGRETPIKQLSGGNQQKVILARWLLTNPELLILDEPTRGIDVGTKTEIQKLVLKLATDGMSVIFISSEIEEMIRTCQRMVVMRDKKKVGELKSDEISQNNIMSAIAGGE